MVLDSTERIGESMIFTVVNYQSSSFRKFNQSCDVLGKVVCTRANLKCVSNLEVLAGFFREELAGLEDFDDILGPLC